MVLVALVFVSCSIPAARASGAADQRCVPTTTRDASGVITAGGTVGLIGTTVTSEATMAADEPILLVRRGARPDDQVVLRFDNIGNSAPATWVSYGATARLHQNAWSAFAFEFGWKPIGFAGSCWRLVVDNVDSGLVLHVRP